MMPRTFLQETGVTIMKAVVVVGTIVILLVTVGSMYDVEGSISDGSCNIAVLPIEGAILPFHGIGDYDLVITPEKVEQFMDQVEDESAIDAVLLEINSPGGMPVASERMAERFRNSPLPVVGLIGDIGASGGYMVAAASDYLIASPMSDVGSIGINMSYVEESQKNEDEGLTYVQLTTGKFKDIGSPNRPITEEERARLEADLDIVHNEFIDIVARYRDLPREEVVALADGASMPGVTAEEVGLIDSLGGRSEATTVLAEILEIDEADISYCEYESPFVLF
jgi:protease-4